MLHERILNKIIIAFLLCTYFACNNIIGVNILDKKVSKGWCMCVWMTIMLNDQAGFVFHLSARRTGSGLYWTASASNDVPSTTDR